MNHLISAMKFNPTLGWWSPAVFWYVAISVFVCLAFCIVVFVGGLFDLRYLLRSLDEEAADAADDGRVDQTTTDRSSRVDS